LKNLEDFQNRKGADYCLIFLPWSLLYRLLVFNARFKHLYAKEIRNFSFW